MKLNVKVELFQNDGKLFYFQTKCCSITTRRLYFIHVLIQEVLICEYLSNFTEVTNSYFIYHLI